MASVPSTWASDLTRGFLGMLGGDAQGLTAHLPWSGGFCSSVCTASFMPCSFTSMILCSFLLNKKITEM